MYGIFAKKQFVVLLWSSVNRLNRLAEFENNAHGFMQEEGRGTTYKHSFTTHYRGLKR
jgi:hypothetical protein